MNDEIFDLISLLFTVFFLRGREFFFLSSDSCYLAASFSFFLRPRRLEGQWENQLKMHHERERERRGERERGRVRQKEESQRARERCHKNEHVIDLYKNMLDFVEPARELIFFKGWTTRLCNFPCNRRVFFSQFMKWDKVY